MGVHPLLQLVCDSCDLSDAGGGPWELFQDFSNCHLMDSWILSSTFHMMRHVLAPAWPTFPLVGPLSFHEGNAQVQETHG